MSFWVEKAERDLALARQEAALAAEKEAEEAAELAGKEAKKRAEIEALARSKFPPMGPGFQI